MASSDNKKSAARKAVAMSKTFSVRTQNQVRVPMRDGVHLSADIYFPDGDGRFPTVLMRTPYDNNSDVNIQKARCLASLGYACVLQDCRGRYDSDGIYYPLINEGPDGYDTQEWIGRQPWCNGRIGMCGASYLGWVQWSSAPLRSRYLTCLAPRVMTADLFRGLQYQGGAFFLGVMMTWGMGTSGRTMQSIRHVDWNEAFRFLPLRDADRQAGLDLGFWKDWLDHQTYDDYWKPLNIEARWGEFSVPAFNMGGWFDLYSTFTIHGFTGLRQHGRTPEARQSKLIMGPWAHSLSVSTKTGDVDFGAPSQVDLDGMELRWFDYWLKGIENGIMTEPPVRLFIMGSNSWRDEQEWPLARTNWQLWYFHSQGKARTLLGDGLLTPDQPGEESPDTYTYHPDYPVPTLGGNNCCSPEIIPWGPYDQRSTEMRSDVLCYTSAPLQQDLEVTGPIKVILYAATDCPDTDWTAKLLDVRPSGYAMSLCDGIQRARYRESLTQPTLLEPGKVYRYEIDVMVTAHVFQKGHSIRVEISSSNFPRFDRNPNTGHPIGKDREIRIARQIIWHSLKYPSHILLPVIPSG